MQELFADVLVVGVVLVVLLLPSKRHVEALRSHPPDSLAQSCASPVKSEYSATENSYKSFGEDCPFILLNDFLLTDEESAQ